MTMNGRQPNLPTPEDFERLSNPTGGNQTRTPWHKTVGIGQRPAIADDVHRWVIATFDREEDRDFALFWVNSHPGVISLLRGFKHAFEFIARGSAPDDTMHTFASHQAEMAGIWEQFFTTLGQSASEYLLAAEKDNRHEGST